MRRSFFGVVALVLLTAPAFAQSSGQYVRQSGTVTIATVPYWVNNSVVGAGVTAADSPVTSFGVTTTASAGNCVNSARKSSGAWLALCLGYSSGTPTISVQNYGSATAKPLQFIVNGTTYAFPASLSSITIGSTPVVSGASNAVLYDNAGVAGDVASVANGVMSANGSGVPVMSTTLPSALTIPSPTFTGAAVFPDSATWGSTGITGAAAISVGTAALPSGGNISISGQYQVNGTQISISNLSNGATGSGNVVLATSPTIAGTWAGSPTFSGNLTFSGNDTFSGQAVHTGTSAPSSAAGNTVVLGTLAAAPTLTNTGQSVVYNTTAGGAVVSGDGSSDDFRLYNKSGGLVLNVPTGTTVPELPGLASGTCSSGLAIDSGNNLVKVACPGAASAITVGTTTIGSGTTGYLLYNNGGTLGNETIASVLTAGSGISITGTTNATIAQSLTNATLQASPVNPAVLTSSSFLMEGFGSTCHITPVYSGRIKVSFNFDMETGTAAITLTTKVMYGTGTAPTNGAAVAGTQVGNVHATVQQVGGDNAPITHGSYVVAGLSTGTAYWLDVAAQGDGTHGLAISNVSCSAMEF